MRRMALWMLAGAMTLALTGFVAAQNGAPGDGGERKGPPPGEGPGGGGGGGGMKPGGPGAGGPPGGVHIIPPFVMNKLKLTKEQQDQVAALEKETKEKLDKILTPEQKKIMEETRPPRRGEGGPGGGPGGQSGPGGGGAEGANPGPGGGQGGEGGRPKGPPPPQN